METKQFFEKLLCCETDRVKAFHGKVPNALHRIPVAFIACLEDMVGVLQENLEYLCAPHQSLYIIGLQPAAQMIESSRASKQERYVDMQHPSQHFCCTLDYTVADTERANKQPQWSNTHSVVVDFSEGLVMDRHEYLSRLQLSKQPGKVLGKLKSERLDKVWQNLVHKRKFTTA